MIADEPMRSMLKGGEVVEGVPENVTVDSQDAPPRDVPRDERAYYGVVERTVTINGTEVLAEEVESFTVGARTVRRSDLAA